MHDSIHKYPRTRHIEGSALQEGDEDLAQVRFRDLAGHSLVVEEKMDGANAAVSFTRDGTLLLQSRGHFLTGGRREEQFTLFKQWAQVHQGAFRDVLGSRFVMYGEWLYAKHTIYYDLLPHYFLEFDVLDTDTGTFLDTPRRHALLHDLPVTSVRVISSGSVATYEELVAHHGPSPFKSPAWRDGFAGEVAGRGLQVERALRETDPSPDMEGLYLKHEENGVVVGRYKHVRAGFLATVVASESHWQSRPIVPNGLAPGVELFA